SSWGGAPAWALAAAPAATRIGFVVRLAHSPAASGSGVVRRPEPTSLSAWGRTLSRFCPGRMGWSEPEKVSQAPVTWTVLVVFGYPARVWCSAWVRVCRLSAGPASAAKTQQQTSRASARALPAAVPTVRLTLNLHLMPPPPPAVRRRHPAAAPG